MYFLFGFIFKKISFRKNSKYKSIKNKEDVKPGIIPILVYIAIVIVMFLISLISPILYARYLFTITGLLIFFLSFFMAKEKNRYITIGICIVIAIMAIFNNVKVCQENYDESNGKQIEYLKENLQSGDIIIYKEIGQGGVVAVQTQDYKQYFVNLYNWSIEEAYKAYAPQKEVAYSVEEIENNIDGRLVIIDTPDYSFYNNDFNNNKLYDNYNKENNENSNTIQENNNTNLLEDIEEPTDDEQILKEKMRKEFLDNYNLSDFEDEYEETPRKRHKGKRFK